MIHLSYVALGLDRDGGANCTTLTVLAPKKPKRTVA